MLSYLIRTIRLFFGLFLYALGCTCCIRGDIGLAPWDSFHMGLAYVFGVSLGTASITCSLIILVLVYFMKEKIGFGTLANGIMVGFFTDKLLQNEVIPLASNYFVGVIMVIVGLFTVAMASYFYIGAGMGCGTRDCLMVAIYRRCKKIPVGVIRSTIEAIALVAGIMCGSKFGFGTILSVLGIGAVIQFTFKILHFELKEIKHEDFSDTIKNISSLVK